MSHMLGYFLYTTVSGGWFNVETLPRNDPPQLKIMLGKFIVIECSKYTTGKLFVAKFQIY